MKKLGSQLPVLQFLELTSVRCQNMLAAAALASGDSDHDDSDDDDDDDDADDGDDGDAAGGGASPMRTQTTNERPSS